MNGRTIEADGWAPVEADRLASVEREACGQRWAAGVDRRQRCLRWLRRRFVGGRRELHVLERSEIDKYGSVVRRRREIIDDLRRWAENDVTIGRKLNNPHERGLGCRNRN